MFTFYIHNIIWLSTFKLCGLKLLWMFLFVVLCISAFVMVMCNCDKEELKKSMLYNDWTSNKLLATKIKSAENALSTIEIMSRNAIRNRFKSMLSDLEKDLWKTEAEVNILQNEVWNLSKRRDNLKSDLLNQQTGYQNMLDAIGTELDGNDHALSRTRRY